MKKTLLITLLFCLFTFVQAQILNESFDSGIPTNWTQGNGAITWTANNTLGASNTGCAMADFSNGSGSGTNWLQTHFVDLSTVSNPEIRFSVALIRNNFLPPDISLWYDNGNGWQQLSSWGGMSAVNNITQTFSSSPLDENNVTWVDVSYDLAALATNTNIRFSFGADFTNGGWVLVDDVSIVTRQPPTIYTLPYTQDFESTTFIPTDWEAFGATNAVWQRTRSASGFGNSTACMNFNNFSNPATNGNLYGLRCVPINLSGTTNPTLEFDVAYAMRTGTNSDRLGIWYSFNGVTNWNNLQNYDSANLSTAPAQSTYFIPTETQWRTIRLDLSQFNTASYIRFAFENNSSNGNVVYVDNVRFFDDNTTGLSNLNKNNKLAKIYPNPSSGKYFILSENTPIGKVSVYNTVGQPVRNVSVFSTSANALELNMENQASGVYYIFIETNNNVEAHKISLKTD